MASRAPNSHQPAFLAQTLHLYTHQFHYQLTDGHLYQLRYSPHCQQRSCLNKQGAQQPARTRVPDTPQLRGVRGECCLKWKAICVFNTNAPSVYASVPPLPHPRAAISTAVLSQLSSKKLSAQLGETAHATHTATRYASTQGRAWRVLS